MSRVAGDDDSVDDHHVRHLPGLPPHLRPHWLPHRPRGPGEDDQRAGDSDDDDDDNDNDNDDNLRIGDRQVPRWIQPLQ